MWDIILAVISSMLLLAGLAGIILPFLPGVPLAWLGLFIYALGTGFSTLSVTTIIVFGVLTVLTLILDFLAPLLGARKYRATCWGVLGASAGLLLGILLFAPWGLILGPFLGALAGELLSGRTPGIAWRVAGGAVVGFLAGTLVKMVVVLVMIGYFVVALF